MLAIASPFGVHFGPSGSFPSVPVSTTSSSPEGDHAGLLVIFGSDDRFRPSRVLTATFGSPELPLLRYTNRSLSAPTDAGDHSGPGPCPNCPSPVPTNSVSFRNGVA